MTPDEAKFAVRVIDGSQRSNHAELKLQSDFLAKAEGLVVGSGYKTYWNDAVDMVRAEWLMNYVKEVEAKK